jgi:hypothetical protein
VLLQIVWTCRVSRLSLLHCVLAPGTIFDGFDIESGSGVAPPRSSQTMQLCDHRFGASPTFFSRRFERRRGMGLPTTDSRFARFADPTIGMIKFFEIVHVRGGAEIVKLASA